MQNEEKMQAGLQFSAILLQYMYFFIGMVSIDDNEVHISIVGFNYTSYLYKIYFFLILKDSHLETSFLKMQKGNDINILSCLTIIQYSLHF